MRTLRTRNHVLLFIALAAAVSAVAPIAQARPAGAATTRCAVLVGPRWTSRAAGVTLSGTRYTVVAKAFPCARALKLVPGLVTQSGIPFGRTLRGPDGFACLSDIGDNNPHAIAGVCHRSGGRSFSWGPKVR